MKARAFNVASKVFEELEMMSVNKDTQQSDLSYSLASIRTL
jgi:hypothetical protein